MRFFSGPYGGNPALRPSCVDSRKFGAQSARKSKRRFAGYVTTDLFTARIKPGGSVKRVRKPINLDLSTVETPAEPQPRAAAEPQRRAAVRKVMLCHSCSRTEIGSFTYCEYCHGELQKVIELYQRIVRLYPGFRSVSISELFERLYKRATQAHDEST